MAPAGQHEQVFCRGECPICLETRDDCVRLTCGHVLCYADWRDWMNTLSHDLGTEVFNAVAEGEVPAATAELRQASQQEWDDASDSQRNEKVVTWFRGLEQHASLGEKDQIRRKLEVAPGHYLLNSARMLKRWDVVGNVEGRAQAPIVLLQAFIEAIVKRRAELDSITDTNDRFLLNLSISLGTAFEIAGQYHTAIPWYKKAVRMIEEGYFDDEPTDTPGIAPWHLMLGALNNLGLALKKGCQLDEALACYSRVIDAPRTVSDPARRHSKDNRKTLMSDMREWTGTALEHDLEDLRAYRKLEGRRVVLQGLSSTTMNGTAGTATKFNNKRGRYFVEIDGGGRRLIKPENLRHGDADGDAAAEPQAP
mmetsp:Transcript_89951/g.257267  ORF Transcript_89951/g.257267 Transcript_89951/m.257267 type:complete len:366 (+) Transcript_89951:768-1865(+)